MARRSIAASLALALCSTARAQSDPQDRVRIEAPACPSMPFAHEELARLLAVELAVHRLRLVEDAADTVIRYGAVACGVSGSAVWVVVARGDAQEELQVPGASPRALALYLAEMLREGEAPAPQAPIAPPAVPVAAAPALIDATSFASSLSAPTLESLPAPREPVPPDRSIGAGSFVSGVLLVDSLGNPLHGSWLLGLRTEIGLRLPQWRHLRLHVDTGFAMGRSDWSIHLGSVSVGAMAGIAMGSADHSLELGVRGSLSYVWGLSFPNAQFLDGTNGVVIVGGVARGQIRVDGPWSLVADLELGAAIEDGGLGARFFALEICAIAPNECEGGGVRGFVALLRAGVMID